jgi:hypothetical protein
LGGILLIAVSPEVASVDPEFGCKLQRLLQLAQVDATDNIRNNTI